MSQTPTAGRRGPRSKTGCSTCRIRKIKCDEQKLVCGKCISAQLKCDWTSPTPSRPKPGSQRRQSTAATDNSYKRKGRSIAPDSATAKAASRNDANQFSDVEQHALALRKAVESDSLASTPVLSTIEMSNSLILDHQGLRSFQYVPESLMVMRFGKPWRWSMLSYVHSRVASRQKGVMSALIAVASMELRFRNLLREQGCIIALQGLSTLLDKVSHPYPDSHDLEAVFSIWFLLIHCGLYDIEMVKTAQVHLNGIRLFISQYLEGERAMDGLPPAAQQLLYFILYMDVGLALGNLNGGQLSLDLLSLPSESPLFYDRVWESARLCLPKLWGADYPHEEILDDVENYRGLSFLHAVQKLKLSIWKLGITGEQGQPMQAIRQRLWDRIEEIQKEFSDLLILAQAAPSTGGRRVMWTVYHACLDFYATRILFSCLHADDDRPLWLDTTLKSLLAIAYKSLGESPQQLYRCCWPLAVALLKVQDSIHRDWIVNQLAKARVLMSNFGLPMQTLDKPTSPGALFVEYHASPVEETE